MLYIDDVNFSEFCHPQTFNWDLVYSVMVCRKHVYNSKQVS